MRVKTTRRRVLALALCVLLLLSLCTLYFVLSASMRSNSLLRITSLIFSSIVKQLSVSPRFVPADSADKAV